MAVQTTINYDERFDKIEEQIKSLSNNFNDQLDKLTIVVVKGFDRIDKELVKKG